MANVASTFHRGTEFNAFLFAPIGEGRNGMFLSVLSALARQDVDPWKEAAALARLPRADAVQRLTSFIAAQSDELPGRADPPTTAARLIALLPRYSRIEVVPRDVLSAPRPATSTKSAIYVMIVMSVILGAQVFLESRHPQSHIGGRHSPIAGAASQEPRHVASVHEAR
jgi:hypothetical protein